MLTAASTIKRFILFTLLAVFSFSILNFMVPAKPAEALSDDGTERILAAGLATCLYHKIAIEEDDDNIENSIIDYWHYNGDVENITVGRGIDSTNGVWTCNQILDAIAGPLGLSGEDSDEKRLSLENAILGNGTTTGIQNYGANGINGDEFEDLAITYMNNVIVPFMNARPLTDADLAERLLPLLDICFNYQRTAFAGSGDHRFQGTLSSGGTVYLDYAEPDGGDVTEELSLKKNDGFVTSTDVETSTNGIATGSQYDTIKDDMPYDWTFWALGDDFFYPFSTDNGRSHRDVGALASCSTVEQYKDRILKEYLLGADGVLTLKDGRTAAAILSGGADDLTIDLGGANDNPTCESKGASLSWLFCPIINGALDSMDWLFRQFIEPFLVTQPLTTSPDDYVYTVWKNFRTIGNILLVFMLLFVVFGQAIGGGMVDAYTAKKAMPRILVAAILINISYFGVALMVDIFNVIGAGIGQLITAPLDGSGSFSFTPNNFINGGGLLAIGLGGKWVLGLMTQSGFLPLIFLTVLLPMLLLVISIFGTLIVRRGLIIMLAVLAPVAAALYVLPNTEKYAKKWFDLFVKTLVVYPIIMAIFGIADLLSMMLMNASASTSGSVVGFTQDSLSQFVGLIVLFVPFFLIPFSFKIAGGAIGATTNAINSIGKKRLEHFKGNELDPHSRLHEYKAKHRGAKAQLKTKRAQWLSDKSNERDGWVSRRINTRANRALSSSNPAPPAPTAEERANGPDTSTGVGSPIARMRRRVQVATGGGTPLPPPPTPTPTQPQSPPLFGGGGDDGTGGAEPGPTVINPTPPGPGGTLPPNTPEPSPTPWTPPPPPSTPVTPFSSPTGSSSPAKGPAVSKIPDAPKKPTTFPPSPSSPATLPAPNPASQPAQQASQTTSPQIIRPNPFNPPEGPPQPPPAPPTK